MGALQGFRVVEYGGNVSAPYCARLFADLGAEVIKVEPPGGDPSRALGPFSGGSGGPKGEADPEESGTFHYLNAGKRGVVADLADPEQLEFFHGLLAGAGVLVENSEPGEYARFGLDAARRPRCPSPWECRIVNPCAFPSSRPTIKRRCMRSRRRSAPSGRAVLRARARESTSPSPR
jgi:hypothetical protein